MCHWTFTTTIYQDAFSQLWKHKLAWVFSPPFLILRVLSHLNQARGVYLLIIPRWNRVFWRPDIKLRVLAPPFTIHHLDESPSRCQDAVASSECVRDDIRGLKMWGWYGMLKGLDSNQIKLLQEFWRPSIRKVYSVAWKKWLSWCESHELFKSYSKCCC